MGSISVSEDPLEEAGQPTPVFWPGESQGQRTLVGYSPQGGKEADRAEWLTTTAWCGVGSLAEQYNKTTKNNFILSPLQCCVRVFTYRWLSMCVHVSEICILFPPPVYLSL